MTALEPSVSHAIAVWRHELETARDGQGPESPEQVETRRLVVLVRYRGDPPAWREAGLEPGFDSGGLVSGSIAFADLERLGDLPGVSSVAMQPNLNPALDGTVAEMKVPWKAPSGGGFTGQGTGVIVAVIDTGIDIFHESFLKPDGTTRIAELWDQTAGLTGGSNPPAPFMQQGQVYSAAEINAALAAGPPFVSKDTNGHGTHVAGIAAGSGRQDDRCSFPGRYVGVAPDAYLVIVKAIGVTGSNVTDALNWCAQVTIPPGSKPVVINCSFGHDTGPHDGTDALDVAFDALLRPESGTPAGLAVVLAAGNEANADIHESGTIEASGTVTVPFYVRHGSKQPDTMDLWYNGTASLTVELIAPANPAFPGTKTTGPVTPSATNSPVNRVIGGMTMVITSTQPLAGHNNKREIEVSLTVTPPTPPPVGTPPTTALRGGPWQLKLTETAGVAANWDAWFETSHTDPFPTWRLPKDPPAPVPRRQQNTVASPGSMRNGITVAAYSDGNGELWSSSSHGAASQTGIPVGEFKPTVAAPGVAVAAPRGRDNPNSNSSCCDQKVIDIDGTSMASPHVAGLVAVIFQKNKLLTFEQVRAHLQHSARIDGIPAAEVPPVVDAGMNIRANALWGSGKVDALAALNEIPPAAAMGGGGGGGGGGGRMMLQLENLGYTPHTLGSRIGDWRRRFGDHPGVMLLASLVSEHVDEVLWLINHDRRITVAWRRGGGHLLVRRLLYGPVDSDVLISAEVQGHDVGVLLFGFTQMLGERGGERLRGDIGRFGRFARSWPGATLAQLDDAALEFGAAR